METNVYKLTQNVLIAKYGKKRKTWDDIHTDDRAIFCATYDMIMKACEDMMEVKNNFICVAVSRRIREEMEMLERISNVFDDR